MGKQFLGIPLVLSIVALVSVGCSKGPTGPPRYETHGIVTHRDQPVEKSQVVFYPVSAGGKARATLTDEKGHFRFLAAAGNGLPTGEYTVVVRPRPGGDLEVINPADFKFPKKYWKKKTTDLEFSISQGENELEIILADGG